MSDIKLACDVVEQVKTICDKHGLRKESILFPSVWARHATYGGQRNYWKNSNGYLASKSEKPLPTENIH